MVGLFSRLFHGIRRRPPAERRILATSTYVSLAAILVALGITSLRLTIENAGAPAVLSAPANEVAGPLASFWQNLTTAVSRLQDSFRPEQPSPPPPSGQPAEPARGEIPPPAARSGTLASPAALLQGVRHLPSGLWSDLAEDVTPTN